MNIRQLSSIAWFALVVSFFAISAKASETVRIGPHNVKLSLVKQLHALTVEQQNLSLQRFIDTVEEQVVLAAYHDGSADLNLWQQTNTGFDPELTLASSLYRTLQALFPEPVSADRQKALEAQIHSNIPTEAELKLWFTKSNILGYNLTPDQARMLSKHILLKFPAFANKPVLTMAAMYKAQSVQGRIRIQHGERLYIQKLVDEEKAKFIFTQWILEEKLLNKQDLSALRTLIYARLLHTKLMVHFGVEADQHGDNAKRRALAQTVTDQEIAHYYQLNRAQFGRLEQVKAEFWLFDNKQSAREARKKLKQTAIAITAGKRQVFDMTQLTELEKGNKWIANLAAARPVEELSQAVRMPTGQWIVVRVMDKAYGVHPLDSETVRYQARNQLAIKKAYEAFNKLRRQLGLSERITSSSLNVGHSHNHIH